MAKITEDYVSFEVAKLLKEKGFNEPTLAYAYGQDMVDYYSQPKVTDDYNVEAGRYPLPTLQMAMKWLREEKNILIYVYPVIDLQVKNNYTFYWRWDGKKKRHDASHIGNKHNYESFEQAVEAAVKYCLENLI